MAIRHIKYKNNNYKISYELKNNAQKTMLILHGWGANKEIMLRAFKNLEDFTLVFVDLPGFGNSNFHESFKTQDYADILNIFIKELNLEAEYIMGHSYGGKVGVLMNPKNLILLSSAGILNKKKLKIKLKIIIFKILKYCGLKRLFSYFVSKDAKGLSEEMYQTFKNVVNEDFSEIFKNYQGNALIFWGQSDEATPLENGKTIHKLIKNSKFYELKGGHFFFLRHKSFIANEIYHEFL